MTMTPEQRADRIHEIIRANPEVCEHWRRQMNRPTRAELRKEVEGGD